MGEYGSFITDLYHGEKFMGNVSIFPNSNSLPFEREKELRVSSFSATSDRCFPLVILRTIANEGVLLKLEPANLSAESRELEMMHSMCLKEFKTAVIPLAAGTELHLVAMNGRRNMWPCFWGFVLLPGLYSSCLTMLNLRCLALVLDLDETLIVANTMRSFEDRIEALGSKMKGETDAQKVSGMSAELKRYIQDRALLRQYVDNDRVWDNTADKYVSAQVEVVPSSTEGGLPLMRPIVRLQDRNMVFTRINPHVRDTSVLVRLRPAWEELRSYLTAKGRKRFEVFVCTMSEKEYALEMWRLLDPQVQLIKANEILERVVCVKSGSKKSLANVFSSGNCHPKMAMVIDDRLKVWEDRDQSHVHVVPAFAPYHAPQAEINVPLPILCVARNVACDVRGGFFRDFDEGLSKKMAEIDYHADVSTLPQPPVLSSYLVAEEETRPQDELANGNKELSNGMPDAETKKRLAEGTRSGSAQIPIPIPIPIAIAVPVENDELEQLCPPTLLVSTPAVTRPLPTLNETFLDEKYRFSGFPNDLPMLRPITLPQVHSFEPSLQSSLSREEGEVPESELDPDTRRRLLILQHGQDVERTHNSQGNAIDSSLSVKVPLHLTISPPAAPAGGWLGAEEEMSPRQIPKTLSGIVLESDSPSLSKQQSHGPSFFGSSELPSVDGSSHELRKGISEEAYPGGERQRSEYMPTSHLRSSPGTNTANPVSVLQEIAQKCNTKLEFKSLLNTTTKELQFSVEVFFGGEKVGEGIGRTKKEAQYKAADNSVWLMASKYFSSPMQAINIHGLKRLVDSYDEPISRLNTRDPRHFAGLGPTTLDEDAPFASTSGQSKSLDFRHLQESNRAYNPVAALKEYCTMEGINVVFNDMSPALPSLEFQVQGFICQVEVAGRVMGRSSGWTWEDAKQQAAADALRRLRSAPQPRVHPTRMHSPRSPPLHINKRMRTGELPRRLPLSPHKLSPR